MKKIYFFMLPAFLCLSNISYSQPTNDDCSGAITLTQTTTCSPTNGTTVDATQSTTAGSCNGYPDDDVWYKFVAASATPTIQVIGAENFDAVVELRSGSCNGTEVTCVDDVASGGTETINATGLTVGTTYYVRVYSYYSASSDQGTFTICVYGALVAPSNDNCSGATLLTQTTTCSPTNGTTVDATQSTTAGSCGGYPDDDVWYKFVAASATPTIQVIGAENFDAVVELRSGSCNGTEVTCVDDVASGGTETINATGLTVGTTYYVRVYSYYSASSDQGTFTICVYGIPAAPANNDCSEATLLTQTTTCSSPTSGTTVNATQSITAGTCGGTADDDVWYKFVATTATPTITVVGSTGFDAVVDLHSVSCSGTELFCEDATTSGGTETINATGLTIGSTYYMRVYSYGSGSSNQGTFTICVFGAPAAPANNNCSDAITLTQNSSCSPTNGTTVGATQSLVAGSCGGTADDDVWYKFVAASANPIITVVGSAGFDAVIDLHSVSCTGTELDCADATVSGGTETINATGLTIGSTYWVRVYSYGLSSSTQGTFTICVYYAPPSNDDCSGAVLLTQNASCTPTNGTTAGATQSIAAIACGSYTGTADDDVWYKFVAASANPTIQVTSSSIDAVVDLRSGSCDGTNIACADATLGTGTETISASGLTIGSTYYVRVYSYGSSSYSTGPFTICVYGLPSTPANDNCSGATLLTQSTTCSPTSGTTVGATQSTTAGSCGGYPDDDVWYKFVAASATPTIQVIGASNFDAVIELRSGSCSGTEVTCADVTLSGDTETINATGLTVGTTYYVRVYSYYSASSDQGTFTICVYGAGGSVTIPTVTTTAASAIGNNSATSGGNVTADGGATVIARGVCWATTANPVVTQSHTVDGTGTGIFTSAITGLSAGTTYHIRAYAANSAGTAYGNDLTFTTTGTPPSLPTVTTITPSAITNNTATGGGNVTSDGGATIIVRGVCWSTSANPDITTGSVTTDGSGTGTFSSSLTGLSASTTYHIRAYATNSVGTAYGSDLTFTTSSGTVVVNPTVTTTQPYSITGTGALSGGDVLSDGGASVTAKGVCYSISVNPDISGSHTSDGTGTGTFTSTITGLTAGTIYHVRAYATNSAGTAYGSDLNFTTTGGATSVPSISTSGAYSITNTTASCGGDVTADGSSSVTARGVCYGTSVNPDISGSHTSDGTGTGTFTSNLSGLTAGTTYHIRAYATNSSGTGYGSDLTFITTGGNVILPTVTTSSAYSIGNTYASCGGDVTSDGGAQVTARGVCWSTTANPDITASHTNDGAGTGSFTSSLIGLSANTTYHIRAYATNSAGTAYGSDDNFTTLNVGIIPVGTTAENINIYPNPTKDKLNIEFELGNPENVTLTLQNYLSQQLITESITNYSGSYKKTIDLSNLAVGIYNLKIQIGENVYNNKVIVVK